MSRLGKQEIMIPSDTQVRKDGTRIFVKGPLGEVSKIFRDEITITIEGDKITLKPRRTTLFSRALWGTYASHLKNMIAGTHTVYEKKLVLEGVGFKADISGKDLVMALGFSHPVKVPVPEGLNVKAEKGTLTISGIDKDLVGEFSASVRALKKPEPYKGKGFRYQGEVIRRKQGKKSA